jgi:hypothetical protein
MRIDDLSDYEGLLVDKICPDCGSYLVIKCAMLEENNQIKFIITCMQTGCPNVMPIMALIGADILSKATDQCVAIQSIKF